MSDFKVNVDFDRLNEYFLNYTVEQVALLKSQGGVLHICKRCIKNARYAFIHL
ncbi:hypothetical protein SAMN04488084_11021 [Pedobacter antarcticus]|nr:hypothetical protein SAMN04488084_11021 [Pedobacter antarcticus]